MPLPSVDILLDVLMKNEAVHTDMVDILIHIQSYLGENYPRNCKVGAGGDQMTVERERGAQRHQMDGDTVEERLGLLVPDTEDPGTVWWFC